MTPDLQQGFRLHDRTVLPAQDRITGGGEDDRVGPRTMAVLVCLAEHAGEVVSREFLDEHVWRGSVVTDHALTNCMSTLRRCLGDTRDEPRFIETVPKRGYRLIAPITPLGNPGQSKDWPSRRSLPWLASLLVALLVIAGVWWFVGNGSGATDLEIPEKSVAVLPFVNESGDKNQQYFADGLSQDLITALSQFGNLKVISRHSSFQLRNSTLSSAEMGRELGVAHLLEGNVRRAGDVVRINATLVNAADGSIVWSHHYDRPYKDLFALQNAIVKAVAGALQAQLLNAPGAVPQSDRPPGGSLAAYAAYQHGLTYFALGTAASFHRAVEAYNKAIHLDPRYAAAYAQLART